LSKTTHQAHFHPEFDFSTLPFVRHFVKQKLPNLAQKTNRPRPLEGRGRKSKALRPRLPYTSTCGCRRWRKQAIPIKRMERGDFIRATLRSLFRTRRIRFDMSEFQTLIPVSGLIQVSDSLTAPGKKSHIPFLSTV
jgi:hypothetical protein